MDSLDLISDEALLIAIRQLDFFYVHGSLTKDEFVNLAERLFKEARRYTSNADFNIPTVRFGWTEIQMPVITCEEFTKNRMKDLLFKVPKKLPKEDSLRAMSLKLLDLGILYVDVGQLKNAFEIRLLHTLSIMIENGEVKREHIIIHAKFSPRKTRYQFEKEVNKIWNEHLRKLEYIDLCSFHVAGKNCEVDWLLDKSNDMCYAAALELQNEGKVRSIGFSTESSSPENILRLICSNHFEYVNLHYHFLGRETSGHEHFSNLTCIKKALELDMGVLW